MNKSKTALIIGGGLGGLFTGAILSREGIRVTILEKNATVGGGLQSFQRFGEHFDTGMHVVGGMQQGGNIYRLCEYLGVLKDMHLMAVDSACADALYFAQDRKWYNIACGSREAFIQSIARYFRENISEIERYVQAVEEIVDSMSLFNLRVADDTMTVHGGDFLLPADEFIKKYITNEKLRSVVAYMNPLYSGRGGMTPAYVHAVITALYIQGCSRFIGGTQRFANTLRHFIEQHNGIVHVNEPVSWVEVNSDRHVEYVLTKSQKRYTADYYISAIHPCALLTILPQHAFTKAYATRLNTIPNSYSAFSLYIKLKENTFPYINHSEYYMTRYADIWHFCEEGMPWPMGFLFMTPPDDNQGEYARKVLITAPMAFKAVAPWENTTYGHRPKDYSLWKEQRTNELLSLVEEMHPGFCSSIEAINSSSPLTIRDFYNAKEGGISGYSKDCKNIALSQLPVVTKVHNLYLTGQNNSLHGFCGVPLTAITTAEAILGKNYILKQLALCHD